MNCLQKNLLCFHIFLYNPYLPNEYARQLSCFFSLKYRCIVRWCTFIPVSVSSSAAISDALASGFLVRYSFMKLSPPISLCEPLGPFFLGSNDSKEHSALGTTPDEAYNSSKIPLRFLPAETVANAFLRVEQRKVDKSGCISFGGKKYEVGVIYVGRKVDIVYDAADTSVLTVEDKHFDTRFQIKELVIGSHTGPRPKLPDFMTPSPPETSRLLDEKVKRYDSQRNLSVKRVISYAQINKSKGGDKNV